MPSLAVKLPNCLVMPSAASNGSRSRRAGVPSAPSAAGSAMQGPAGGDRRVLGRRRRRRNGVTPDQKLPVGPRHHAGTHLTRARSRRLGERNQRSCAMLGQEPFDRRPDWGHRGSNGAPVWDDMQERLGAAGAYEFPSSLAEGNYCVTSEHVSVVLSVFRARFSLKRGKPSGDKGTNRGLLSRAGNSGPRIIVSNRRIKISASIEASSSYMLR